MTPSGTSDALPWSDQQRYQLFEGNARKVYPRIAARLAV